MFCPLCGTEAGDARFCVECGADLDELRSARSAVAKVAEAVPQKADQTRRSPSTKLILIVAAVILAVAVAAVIVVVDRGSSSPGTPSASASAPASPSLSGSYADLVARAEGYYQKGQPYADSGNFTAAAPWYAAAAKVLAAAWKKQPGDPIVGANYANALFYSGNIEGAIKQIDEVLKTAPKDQAGLLDKANFVNMAGQMDKQSSATAQAATEIAAAKQLYRAVIAIDPSSASGKDAAAQLKKL